MENSLEGIEAALADGFKIDLGEEDVLTYDVDYATERQDGHRASYRLATLMEKLRLRIAVRRDGRVEITGFLRPTPVGASAISSSAASRTPGGRRASTSATRPSSGSGPCCAAGRSSWLRPTAPGRSAR